jgi:hypothetical protein
MPNFIKARKAKIAAMKSAHDAEFNESDHPRAENGKFGSGGSGGKSVKTASETHRESASQSLNRAHELKAAGKIKEAEKAYGEYIGHLGNYKTALKEESYSALQQAHALKKKGDMKGAEKAYAEHQRLEKTLGRE